MSTSFDDFMPEILLDVPTCPEVIAIRQICNAAIEFCEKTKAWQYDMDPIAAVGGTSAYDLDLPSSSEAVTLESLSHLGDRLSPTSRRMLNDWKVNWQAETGNPKYFFLPSLTEFRVVPIPTTSNANAFLGTVVLKPTRSATTIDSTIASQWMEVIAAGAKARLMMMPKRVWTDFNMAAVMEKQFKDGINAAVAVIQKTRTRVPLRVKYEDA